MKMSLNLTEKQMNGILQILKEFESDEYSFLNGENYKLVFDDSIDDESITIFKGSYGKSIMEE